MYLLFTPHIHPLKWTPLVTDHPRRLESILSQLSPTHQALKEEFTRYTNQKPQLNLPRVTIFSYSFRLTISKISTYLTAHASPAKHAGLRPDEMLHPDPFYKHKTHPMQARVCGTPSQVLGIKLLPK